VQGPVLAVDPGRRTGLALVDHAGVLVGACVVDRERGPLAAQRVAACITGPLTVVVEVPQILSSRRDVAADDIVWLAYHAGRYAGAVEGAGRAVVTVRPSEWKGRMAKSVHQARVREGLDAAARVVWDSVDHNGRDAIAMALWWGWRR
jgi:hypothetical protein